MNRVRVALPLLVLELVLAAAACVDAHVCVGDVAAPRGAAVLVRARGGKDSVQGEWAAACVASGGSVEVSEARGDCACAYGGANGGGDDDVDTSEYSPHPVGKAGGDAGAAAHARGSAADAEARAAACVACVFGKEAYGPLALFVDDEHAYVGTYARKSTGDAACDAPLDLHALKKLSAMLVPFHSSNVFYAVLRGSDNDAVASVAPAQRMTVLELRQSHVEKMSTADDSEAPASCGWTMVHHFVSRSAAASFLAEASPAVLSSMEAINAHIRVAAEQLRQAQAFKIASDVQGAENTESLDVSSGEPAATAPAAAKGRAKASEGAQGGKGGGGSSKAGGHTTAPHADVDSADPWSL